MKGLLKYIFLLLFAVNFQSVNAQFRLIMEMIVTDEGKKLSGAQIKVFKDGALVETVLTDAKGLADIPMEANGEYSIEVGGNKGFIKKKLSVNTKNVPPEGAKGDVFFPAEVKLFNKLEGMDVSILDKPIGKIFFDPEFGEFGADPKYTKTIQKQFEQLEKDFLAQKAAANEKAKNAQKEYDAAIKIADKAFADEDWEKAQEQYRIAEKVNPDPLETYPSFQLAELKTKLIKINADNKKYDEAISKADAAVASKDFEIAIAEYKRASGYKPKEEYPKTKIKEVQDLLANAAKVEQSYLAAIEKGDNALKINDMNTAKAAFQEAATLKPDETYPKNKISEIDDILAKQNAKQAEYDNTIKEADDALAAKEYEKSKAAYLKAKGLRPAEKYPVDQIARVEGLMAAAAKLEQEYLSAIQKGDQSLGSKAYAEAKTAFEKASQLKPEEEYPKNKIKEINDLIAKNEAQEKEYQTKIAEADKALASKNYEEAKAAYVSAKGIKPSEAYPQQKITEIEGIIAELAKAEESYKAAIAKGDKAITAKDFETAKTAFTEALSIKPKEQYPQDKLAEIQTIVLNNQKNEEKYNTAIQNGDDAVANQDLEKAKQFYTEALTVKPSESYPKDKIAEIEKTIAAQLEKDKGYNDALAAADDAMNKNDFNGAKSNYQKALTFKPEESYPKEQIAKIETQIAEKEKLDSEYTAAIKEGDNALSAKEYEKAKTAFQKATGLKSEEAYPKTKITEIDAILAELKGKEELYTKAIEKGDNAFNSGEFERAKEAFEEALTVKEDDYPKGKITEIKAKLAEIEAEKKKQEKLEADYQEAIATGDKNAGEKNFDAAIASFTAALALKPEEAYPADKIKALTEEKNNAVEAERLAKIQKEYDVIIAKADAAFNNKKLEEAKVEYKAALALKADETYPKERIAEIDKQIAADEEEDKKYKDAIGAADNLLVEEKYEEAKVKYTEASSIKPDQEFPKEKIKEIDKKLADLAAEQEEIRLQNEKAAELEANYQAAIAEADKLFNAEKYEEAKPKYEAAIAIKDEQYPKDKIAEIISKLSSIEEQKAAAAKQAKIDAEYQALVTEADGLFAAADYDGAKAKYEAAIAVKNEQYPKDKIAEIATKLAELSDQAAAEAAAAKQAKIDAEYQALVTEADGLFAAADYDGAKAKYEAAILVKNEQYPKDKMEEIATKLAELSDQAAAEAAAAKQAKIDAEYQALVTEADGLFAAADYDGAKAKYEAAIAVKNEQYPKDKIEEIATKLAELSDQAAAEAAAAKQAKIDAEYQALVTEADGLFAAADYDGAKAKYEAALLVKNEQYPKDKMAQIGEKLLEKANAEAEAIRLAKIETDYLAAIEKGDQALSSNNFQEALSAFKNASQLKSNEQYPINKIAEVNELIANKEAENAEALAEINKKYAGLIQEGQTALDNKDLKLALSKFQDAQNTKPQESLPSEKIKEIKDLENRMKAEEEAIRIRKEQAAANESSYQTALANGDRYYAEQNWNDAENEYRLAKSLKPEEAYPKEQLEKILAILAKKQAELDAAEQEKKAALEKEGRYNDLIKRGDETLAQKLLKDAKRNFEDALKLKPGEAYPIAQLVKVNELLAAEKLAEAERRKNLDKPIQIQTGSRATIDGDAEAEIERLYEELWAKQNSDKNAVIQEKEELLNKVNEQNLEKEEQRRQNALEMIESISITMQDQFELTSELNLQNYESLKEQEEELRNNGEYLERESQKRIENNRMDEEQLVEAIKENQEEKDLWIVEGKKEMVENEYNEIKETQDYRTQEHEKVIQGSSENYRELELALLDYRKFKNDQFYPENYKKIIQDQEELKTTEINDSKESFERRDDALSKANTLNTELYRNAQEKSESFKNNQLEVEEQEKTLREVGEELEVKAEATRNKNAEEDFYIGEKKERQDQSSADYPQGVTEEIIENQNNSTTIRRIVVEGTRTDIYEKTLYKWGGIFYTKNGNNITEDIWDKESR